MSMSILKKDNLVPENSCKVCMEERNGLPSYFRNFLSAAPQPACSYKGFSRV